ncbi:MAG: fumarylacetoacetate hydrolase family protein [Rhizomicrobium sp.]
MRWISYRTPDGAESVGIAAAGGYRGLPIADLGADLLTLVAKGSCAQEQAAARLSSQPVISADAVAFLTVIPRPSKIICIGLNYAAHSEETGFRRPVYPAVFARYPASLVAHRAPIVRPNASEQLDYEGELAVIVGRGGRHIPEADALERIAGYSVFNDGSIRDYQRKSAQWTMGKTFDSTGGFGPEPVTADELPPGCKGLWLETRLNGQVVQRES